MPVSEHRSEAAKRSLALNDGTRQLLQWGSWMVGTGVLAAILLEAVFGGFVRTGATTNAGWFSLIVALMCIPFGGLLLLLGLAKWLRNKAIARREQRSGF